MKRFFAVHRVCRSGPMSLNVMMLSAWNEMSGQQEIFCILQTIKKAAMRIPFENISNKVRDIYSKVSNRGNALFGFLFYFSLLLHLAIRHPNQELDHKCQKKNFIFWNSKFTMIFHTFGTSVFSQRLFHCHLYSVIMSLDIMLLFKSSVHNQTKTHNITRHLTSKLSCLWL